MSGGERAWWKEAVVYQIYPQSFNDSDGDGIGDIPGIVEKADYLDDLGVDVVWLNPVYDSPHADNGYDIRDYRAILDEFGTMADWERLIEELHDRDIRLIMDLVVNHTSDEHDWFLRSREDHARAGDGDLESGDRDDPDADYRDWYVWRDGDPDDPPNNWTGAFGGSAWTYDEDVGKWYLHLFLEKQPDLNWKNPEVREAVYDMMEWWLEEGIDGFRMDVINLLSKPQSLPDGDPDDEWVGHEHFIDGPRIDEYLTELTERTLDNYDTMNVGECVGATPEHARRYIDGGLDMIFHFEHVRLDWDEEDGWWRLRDWDLTEFKEVFTRWDREVADEGGWNATYLGNHDQPRIVSRFGDDDQHRVASAKTLATFLLTMRGTPYIMQGDEIGMTNYPFESMSEVIDPQTAGRVREGMAAGRIDSFDDVRHLVRARSRDNARTPVQWTDGEHAGFTEGDPWLPVNPDHASVNVADARADEDSVWHYYRDLIALRDDHAVIVYGDYDLLLPDHREIYAYTRTLDDETLLVVCNFDDGTPTFELPDGVAFEESELLIGTHGGEVAAAATATDREPTDAPAAPERFDLRPWESRVYLLS
ncbi:glucohydrolase [Halobacteriales archaeon QS_5_70_17]|nr:MAG: glucohydrolase [Halobacteriales archaeon QS_5_70_17]